MKQKSEQNEILLLSQLKSSVLRNTHEFSGRFVKDRIKDRHETHENFIARCWIDGFENALRKDNISLILKKEDK